MRSAEKEKKMNKKKQSREMETKEEEMDFRNIMKDIEFLGNFLLLFQVDFEDICVWIIKYCFDVCFR